MTRTATGEPARIVGYIGKMEVRFAASGDHWPHYADNMTLRRGYWVGDHRLHAWVGLTLKGVEADQPSMPFVRV